MRKVSWVAVNMDDPWRVCERQREGLGPLFTPQLRLTTARPAGRRQLVALWALWPCSHVFWRGKNLEIYSSSLVVLFLYLQPVIIAQFHVLLPKRALWSVYTKNATSVTLVLTSVPSLPLCPAEMALNSLLAEREQPPRRERGCSRNRVGSAKLFWHINGRNTSF